jgi:hypothetical protein
MRRRYSNAISHWDLFGALSGWTTLIPQALVNLALHEGSGAQLVQEGAVPPLVQLCAKAEDKQVY